MQNSPFGAGTHEFFTLHPWAMILLLPFVIMFVWASIKEYQRWRRFGSSMNKRGAYDIDETAPSYEPPKPNAGKDDT